MTLSLMTLRSSVRSLEVRPDRTEDTDERLTPSKDVSLFRLRDEDELIFIIMEQDF